MQELEDFPLTVNSPQIENIALPQTMLAEDGAVLFSLREGPDRNGQGAAP